jgi:hypothetical protein
VEGATLAADHAARATDDVRQATCSDLEDARSEVSPGARRYEVVDPTKRHIAYELETPLRSNGSLNSRNASAV